MHDPIAHMNRWRDIHRANGTSGGKGNAVKIDRRNAVYCPMRDAVARMHLATSDAIEQFRFDVFLAPEFMPFAGQWVQGDYLRVVPPAAAALAANRHLRGPPEAVSLRVRFPLFEPGAAWHR